MPGLKANGAEMNWNSQGNDWNNIRAQSRYDYNVTRLMFMYGDC